jgi:hypothetical protein
LHVLTFTRQVSCEEKKKKKPEVLNKTIHTLIEKRFGLKKKEKKEKRTHFTDASTIAGSITADIRQIFDHVLNNGAGHVMDRKLAKLFAGLDVRTQGKPGVDKTECW